MAQQKVTITGTIKGLDENYELVVYKLDRNKVVFVKTSVKKGGSFSVEGNISVPGVYYAEIKKEKIDLILEPGQDVVVNADMNDFQNSISIKGSPDTEYLYGLKKEVQPVYLQLSSLKEQYKAAQSQKEKNAIIQKFSKLKTNLDIKIAKTLSSNPSSIANLFFIDQLDKKKFVKLYAKISERMKKRYPENEFVSAFYEKVKVDDLLAIGKVAPEIDLPGVDGENISLSSLRGNVVLIDFWASWCGPCRHANPHIVSLYEKYKDKGFKVYSVSLDKSKDKWIKAIAADKLSWDEHVSDLKFWGSDAAKVYGVNSIPATFLLDKEGKILAKNLKGPKLDKKLEEIFGE